MTPAQRLWYEAASRVVIEAEQKAAKEKEARRDDDTKPPEPRQ